MFLLLDFFANTPGYRMSETRVCCCLYEVEISFVVGLLTEGRGMN